tara:strand:+ start:459 stop:797 length:339 start_codon:yes stop_codon:yes gene_type:complete
MKSNSSFDPFEYLSLLLVISFFLFNNIYIVFLGLILAIYSLNSKKLLRLSNIIVNKLKLKNHTNKEEIKISKPIDLTNTKSINSDSTLSLVEKIEKSGFIPLLDKNEDSSVA